MILEEKNKIQNTNIDNFNSFKVNISSVAVKAMIDMYTNKELAVVRELLTNAWDSHIAANNTDIPIDVDLFYTEPNVFRIRDYGTGISEEDMQDYCTIYHSSKKNSNEQTGCWGVGSKVPFAIVDNYLVTTYYNGIKLTYLMSISDSIPKFSLLSKEETTEPNGLELQITTDRVFSLTQSLKEFYMYSDIKLNILSNENINKYNIIYQTNNFKIYEKSYYNSSILLDYGNNIYRIDYLFENENEIFVNTSNNNISFYSSIIDLDKYSNFIETLICILYNFNLALVIKVPLSTGLTIVPSRESFEATEDNKNKLKKYISTIFLDYCKTTGYGKNPQFIYKNNYSTLFYDKLEIIDKLIDYIDNQYNHSYNLIYKKQLINCLYTITDNAGYKQPADIHGIIFNPTKIFQTKSTVKIFDASYLNTLISFTPLYTRTVSFNYECNLKYNITKKVLILNTKFPFNTYNSNETIRTIKKYCKFKQKEIYEEFNTYDLIIALNNNVSYEVIKPLLKFIQHYYGLELHYSTLNAFINKFRKVKRKKLKQIQTRIINTKSINRFTLNVTKYNHIHSINLCYDVSETVKEILDKYGNNSKIKYCLLKHNDYRSFYHNYISSIKTIIDNLNKLPIGFQNKLNKISDKYLNTSLVKFDNIEYICFIQSPKADKDFVIKKLKTKINNFDIKQFYEELLKALSKLYIYNYSSFSILDNTNIDELSSNRVNNLKYSKKDNKVIPNKILNALSVQYKKHEPTTELGKKLFKQINRIETQIYYSNLFNTLYITDIKSNCFTKYVLHTNKTIIKIKKLINQFSNLTHIKDYKNLIQEIIKYSYRRYK